MSERLKFLGVFFTIMGLLWFGWWTMVHDPDMGGFAAVFLTPILAITTICGPVTILSAKPDDNSSSK